MLRLVRKKSLGEFHASTLLNEPSSGAEDMKFTRTLTAGGAPPALTAKRLEPASPTVKAATKNNNQHDDDDEKCRRVHAVLLW
jgi:hypothetical protein